MYVLLLADDERIANKGLYFTLVSSKDQSLFGTFFVAYPLAIYTPIRFLVLLIRCCCCKKVPKKETLEEEATSGAELTKA